MSSKFDPIFMFQHFRTQCNCIVISQFKSYHWTKDCLNRNNKVTVLVYWHINNSWLMYSNSDKMKIMIIFNDNLSKLVMVCYIQKSYLYCEGSSECP